MAEQSRRRDGPRHFGDPRPSNSSRRASTGRAAESGAGADRSSPTRPRSPELPAGITGQELDPEARRDLRSLSRTAADDIAQHLVAAGQALDSDPETAYAHAKYARSLGARIALVREAAGLTAYATSRFDEALAELKAHRRMSGSPDHLAVIADCERALGRPERALALFEDPSVPRLTTEQLVELRIVVAGARRDLGQDRTAALSLEGPELRSRLKLPWVARLRYAYADALLASGEDSRALEWFQAAAMIDASGAWTDAGERVAELEGITFVISQGDGDGEDDEEPRS